MGVIQCPIVKNYIDQKLGQTVDSKVVQNNTFSEIILHYIKEYYIN